MVTWGIKETKEGAGARVEHPPGCRMGGRWLARA